MLQRLGHKTPQKVIPTPPPTTRSLDLKDACLPHVLISSPEAVIKAPIKAAEEFTRGVGESPSWWANRGCGRLSSRPHGSHSQQTEMDVSTRFTLSSI